MLSRRGGESMRLLQVLKYSKVLHRVFRWFVASFIARRCLPHDEVAAIVTVLKVLHNHTLSLLWLRVKLQNQCYVVQKY